MNIGWIKFATFLLVVLAAVSLLVAPELFRNDLVRLDEEAATQWKQIEVQLVRQNELIPKLVTVTRKYAEYESSLIQSMMDARDYFQNTRANDPATAGVMLDDAISGFLAIAERYPQIKADRQYQALTYEIAGTKNRIATERMRYNESARLLNTRLRQFPWTYVATGFRPREYYMPDSEQLAEPEIGL